MPLIIKMNKSKSGIILILFVILVTVGSSLTGVLGGLTGFTISGIASLFEVLMELIYYAIVMGITGAVGGAISSKKEGR